MDDERIGVGVRPLDPEIAEDREFLAFRLGRLDGEAAGREAVDFALGERPEIAGALEDGDLVEIIRPVERRVHAEAGEAESPGGIGRGTSGPKSNISCE